jgi:hypothetical protein
MPTKLIKSVSYGLAERNRFSAHILPLPDSAPRQVASVIIGERPGPAQAGRRRFDPMEHTTRLIAAGATVVLAVGVGAGIAAAGDAGDDDGEAPITGRALDRARAAALDETGGGQVTETEVGDEESYYEVEVTLDDGTQVDVQLDRGFQVVGSEADEESGGDADGADDD